MYSKYPGIKLVSAVSKSPENIENLSSYAHVVHTTANSGHGKDENASEMHKNENCTCKVCKTIVSHCQICKFVTFLSPSSS